MTVLEQLDATLASYDSDSRSSGSGAMPVVTFREPKTASIRQRPSSSHFNSIQVSGYLTKLSTDLVLNLQSRKQNVKTPEE